MTAASDEEDERASVLSAFDPGSDVMIGLVAVVLLSVLMLVPLADVAHRHDRTQDRVTGMLERAHDLTLDGQRARVFIAEPDRVVLSGARPRTVDVDDILNDEGLQEEIAGIFQDESVPVLIITERGQESAFLLETMFHRAGFTDVARIFVDRWCGYLKSPDLLASCLAGSGPAGGP